jgi:dTDP-4-dehydrorhamnose 3,5-epimerase
MQIEKTNLEGVFLVKPKVFGDNRGFFFESYHQNRYQDAKMFPQFVQDNISRSAKGTLRGLHYQLKKPQAKLLTVIRGAIFDVAVDIRKGSPTFGHWYGNVLSDENHFQLYLSEGFAHGFYVLSDMADVHYKCSDFYSPEDECGVLWNDPEIDILWPLVHPDPLLSEKDKVHRKLKEISLEMLPIKK